MTITAAGGSRWENEFRDFSHLHTSKQSYSNEMHPRKLLAMLVKNCDTGDWSSADLIKATAFLGCGSAGKNVRTYWSAKDKFGKDIIK